MSNREKLKQALHNYIDTLDDEGMYDFITENEITGPDILTCEKCEKLFGSCDEQYLCKERYSEWING